jgi:hypothetical protein
MTIFEQSVFEHLHSEQFTNPLFDSKQWLQTHFYFHQNIFVWLLWLKMTWRIIIDGYSILFRLKSRFEKKIH